MCWNGSHTMYIENFWGGRGSSKYYHGYIEGGGGIKVLKMYYVVCDWSLKYILNLTESKTLNASLISSSALFSSNFLSIIVKKSGNLGKSIVVHVHLQCTLQKNLEDCRKSC